MSVPRRHHIISEMQQRRFTDANGHVHFFDKRRPGIGVVGTTPGNAFVQRDLNTYERQDRTKDTSLETWFSELEGLVAPVIDKIILRTRLRKTPELTEDDRLIWDCFFYNQQKRAPDVYERLGLVDEFKETLPEKISQYERKHGPLAPDHRAELLSPESVSRIIQNTTVLARGASGDKVLKVLAQIGIAVAIVEPPKKSFILGDHPLARFGQEGRLGHPGTELWMPIAHDIAVSQLGPAGQERVIRISGDQVRAVNRVIFECSNVVAARSPELIMSLAGMR